MDPTMLEAPDDWTEEFHGWLMELTLENITVDKNIVWDYYSLGLSPREAAEVEANIHA